MSAVLETVCVCQSIGADPAFVRLCEPCHKYWKGDKRLTSVSKVIRETWSKKPDFEGADPATLENARDRGIVTDRLLSAYVVGKLERIPAGTRGDVAQQPDGLFWRAKAWWDAREFEGAQSQVILADDNFAGTCDLLPPRRIYDLKTTYNIEAFYPVQLGGYADLFHAQFGYWPDEIGIVHLTERFPKPQFIELDLEKCVKAWCVLRDAWLISQTNLKWFKR